MFGFSFSEVVLIAVVTLVAVGPQRLPGMLKSLGQWMRKLRKMTTEVRAQTGIDDLLRAEGLSLNELRSLMRGGGGGGPMTASPGAYRPVEDPYKHIDGDVSREYPPEGPDAKGALPDDLLRNDSEDKKLDELAAQLNPAQATPDHAKPLVAEPKPATDDAKPTADDAKPAADEPQPTAEGARPAS